MKQIDLTIYKNYQQYFSLFDVLIKKNNSNRDLFLEDLDISPSSYHRSKTEGNKVGKRIINKLCLHFGYKNVTDELIEEFEKQINEIYYIIYYKKENCYEESINWIDSVLDEKYIIFPIFYLLKALLLLSTLKKSPEIIVNNNKELFEEIISYKTFYNDDLLQLLEIIDVTLQNDFDEIYLAKDYKNNMIYHTLAAHCRKFHKYIEGIYFAEKANKKYIEDLNFKRLYHCNFVMLNCYNGLLRCEDAYKLAKKQILFLESMEINNLDYEITKMHFSIACIGLKKYSEIIPALSNKKYKPMYTEKCCLLIALYNVNKEEYKNYLEELTNNVPENDKALWYSLDNLLKTKNKKYLFEIEKSKINIHLLQILKKM